MRYTALVLIPALALSAQSPRSKTAKPKVAPKQQLESQNARQAFQQVLDAVNGSWFGAPYREMNAADLQGNLNINLTSQALNAKVDEATQGRVKGGFTKGGKAGLRLKGTYFANGDFRTECTGDFGNLLYYRIGRTGFLYSKELNAYTTRVEPPPSDAPLTYLGWFRQTLNEIKAVYVDGSSFKASMGSEEKAGSRTLQTVVFSAPTSAYDPKKREQRLDDTLDFWKRGRLELVYDKESKLPQRVAFSNDSQGVHTTMNFSYSSEGHLQSLSMANQSKGMEGPGSLTVTYGSDGLISHVNGDLSSKDKRVAFDFGLTWGKGRKASSIRTVPPPGATKKGKDELQSLLLVTLASEILDLQHNGLNLRSVTLANNK
jgi:hypothetical protein